MQPPSEADVIAATESLESRWQIKQSQIDSLEGLRQILQNFRLPGSSGDLEETLAGYFGHCAAEHRLDADILSVQIGFNKRALQAYRSGIILPTHIQRKPSN